MTILTNRFDDAFRYTTVKAIKGSIPQRHVPNRPMPPADWALQTESADWSNLKADIGLIPEIAPAKRGSGG